MDRQAYALAIALFFLGAFGGYFYSGGTVPRMCLPDASVIEPVFSPGAQPAILAAIEGANRSLDIELFQFSNEELSRALVMAFSRRVQVRVLLDPTVQANVATATFLKRRGVQVRWSSPQYTYTHAKYLVADAASVLVGSINWSHNAMKRNREAGVRVQDAGLAARFLAEFEKDWQEGREVRV